MAEENNIKMAQGLAALGRKKKKEKKKKTLGEKQYDTYVSELDSNFDKMGRVNKMYKGASPKIKADLKNKFKKLSDSSEMISSARRETGRTEKAKGGRMGYKGGKSVKKKGGCAIKGTSPILR